MFYVFLSAIYPTFEAFKVHDLSILKLLLSSEGFDINKKNDNRETLLELAIKDSNLGYCKVAIEKEPDLIHDKDGLILTFFF